MPKNSRRPSPARAAGPDDAAAESASRARDVAAAAAAASDEEDNDSASSDSDGDVPFPFVNRFGVLMTNNDWSDESFGEESGSDNGIYSDSDNGINSTLDEDSISDEEEEESMPDLPDLEHIRSPANGPTALDGGRDIRNNDPTCAVCFRKDDPRHPWRRLVTLPCCGLDGDREAACSTRFCAGCLLTMATTRRDPEARGEYPPWAPERRTPPAAQFYRHNFQTRTRQFIDCPRCRDLLVVHVEREESEGDESESDDESTCSYCSCCGRVRDRDRGSVASMSLRRPTFLERCRHAGKKVGMANILRRAALLHSDLIPLPALGGDEEGANVQRLVSYGILERVVDKKGRTAVFRMDPVGHAELIRLLRFKYSLLSGEAEAENNDDDEGNPGDYELTPALCSAVWAFAREFRIARALRMANRLGLLTLLFLGLLPPFPLSACQEWAVTALNLFLLAAVSLFVGLLLAVLVYALSVISVGLVACYFLRRTAASHPQARWWRVTFGAYLACKLASFVFSLPTITVFGVAVPKGFLAMYIAEATDIGAHRKIHSFVLGLLTLGSTFGIIDLSW